VVDLTLRNAMHKQKVKRKFFILSNSLRKRTHGQMITLMGVTLALTVFIISSIPSQLSSTSSLVPNTRSSSLASEFLQIKSMFGDCMNYDLARMYGKWIKNPGDPDIVFYGKTGLYTIRFDVVNTITKLDNQLSLIELHYSKVFTASFYSLSFSHITDQGHVYIVEVTLTLSDEFSTITERVSYSLVFNQNLL